MFNTIEVLRIAFSLCAGVVFLPIGCHAWVSSHSTAPATSRGTFNSFFSARQPQQQQQRRLVLKAATTSDGLMSPASKDENDDDDEEEYEYVEYDILTEPEFMGSEWLVGTVLDRNPDRIVETWARLATDQDGKNVAIWGDNSEGTWSLDVANQFLSISKEAPWGKDIWAGVVDDYYFTQGTVRGWNFFSAAEVKGQWQAKRLGVDPEEAGVAPWFQEEDDEEEETAPVNNMMSSQEESTTVAESDSTTT